MSLSFKKVDLLLLTLTFLIASFGLLAIKSSTGDQFLKQFIFIILGLGFFLLISAIDYQIFRHFSIHLYLVSLGLLVLVLFFGITTRGATRWIDLGIIQFQPTEIAKPAIVLVLASFAVKNNLNQFSNLLKSLGLVLVLAVLIFRQPDLGNVAIFLFCWLAVAFTAGASFKKILSIATVIVFLLPLVWQVMAEYQKERIVGFFAPNLDPTGAGYNIIQSQIAVGSGQIFGRGLGFGTQSHLAFLPEHTTDFIFAAISEELGFFGSFLLIILFFILIYRVLKIASEADFFGSLICAGVAGLIFSQVAVSIGMNLGIIPVVGVTLPLVSSGGSSLVSTFLTIGLVSSIAMRAKKL